MKIKMLDEIEVKLPMSDLMALIYRAHAGEVYFQEKKSQEQKIIRMRAEIRNYQNAFAKLKAPKEEVETVKEGGEE